MRSDDPRAPATASDSGLLALSQIEASAPLTEGDAAAHSTGRPTKKPRAERGSSQLPVQGARPESASSATTGDEDIVVVADVATEKPKHHDDTPSWLRTTAGWAWRLILLVAGVVLIGVGVGRVRLVFVALFLGAVLAAVLRPLRDFFAKKVGPGKAVGAAWGLALLVTIGILAFVVTSVVDEWATVSQHFNTGISQILLWLNTGPLHMNLPVDQATDVVQDARNWMHSHAGALVGDAEHHLSAVFDVAGMLTLAVFCSVYFLSQGRTMWRWVVAQFPRKHRRKLNRAFSAGWQTFAGYARGTAIIALSEGLLAWVFFAVARVPLAAPLAIVMAIGTVIPIFGKTIAIIIATIVALAADGPMRALIVVIGLVVIMQLEERIFEPLIYARTVNLHPVVVAIAVLAGTLLGGIFGAVVAVPVTAVAWSIFSTLRPPRDPADLVSLSKPHKEGRLSKALGRLFGDDPHDDGGEVVVVVDEPSVVTVSTGDGLVGGGPGGGGGLADGGADGGGGLADGGLADGGGYAAGDSGSVTNGSGLADGAGLAPGR